MPKTSSFFPPEKIASISIGNDCSRNASPRSTCRTCLDACPANAISLNDGRVEVDHTLCVECGSCIFACPRQAISGRTLPRMLCESALVADDDLLAPHPYELLQWFFDKGVRSIACNAHALPPRWQSSVDIANTVLAESGHEALSTVKRPALQKTGGASRRDFFRLSSRESNASAKRGSIDQRPISEVLPETSFYHLILARENCTLCGACTRICRTRAIRFERAEQETALIIDHGLCSGCNLCQNTCLEHAITVTAQIEERRIDSHETVSLQCSSCDKPFLSWNSSAELCHICAKRAELYGTA